MLLSNSLYSSYDVPPLSIDISDSSYNEPNKPNINSYIDRELQQNGYIDLSKEFEKYKITYYYGVKNPLFEVTVPLDKKINIKKTV